MKSVQFNQETYEVSTPLEIAIRIYNDGKTIHRIPVPVGGTLHRNLWKSIPALSTECDAIAEHCSETEYSVRVNYAHFELTVDKASGEIEVDYFKVIPKGKSLTYKGEPNKYSEFFITDKKVTFVYKDEVCVVISYLLDKSNMLRFFKVHACIMPY